MFQLPEIYRRFLDALLARNYEAVAGMITPTFRVVLADANRTLNFVEFLYELDRQRKAFPDLGQQIDVSDTHIDELELVITYVMIMHFTGELTSTDRSHTLPPTGAEVRVVSQDRVTFTPDGLIDRIEITSDQDYVAAQLYI